MTTPSAPSCAAVHRRVSDLRAGFPVALRSAAGLSQILALETMNATSLAAFASSAGGRVRLILGSGRAKTLFGSLPKTRLDCTAPEYAESQASAYRLTAEALDYDFLRSIADPSRAQPAPQDIAALLTRAKTSAAGRAGFLLAKIGHLLPAVLVAPTGPAQTAPDAPDEAAILSYKRASVLGLRQVAATDFPWHPDIGARIVMFGSDEGGDQHAAIVVGQPWLQPASLVRIHSACLTGDIFGSLRCDCGPQLRAAMTRMTVDGAGMVIYLAQEGRGIGLVNKLRAYAIQDRGKDTVDSNLALGWSVDERDFLAAAIILRHFGIGRVRLLTNNPTKIAALAAFGIEIEAREPVSMSPNGVNDSYLKTKLERLGHFPSPVAL